ncbi:hypothetical protein Slin15195_G023780 [Septoria linicola]|uniref:Uncharacterized protein n=1 Tax=Septoria linicola TaxID=215465 RepID=A0A9Q9AJJ3_9PEZI|nr:hypothetical protein Slin15195_G023780 [Septoria linicola]
MFTARHNIPPFNVEFHALRLRDEYLPHLKGVKKAICDLDTDSGPELEHGDNLEQELQNVCDELRASLTVVLKWAQAKIEEGKRLGFYDQDHKLLSRWDDCRANELPVAASYSAGNLLAKIVRLKRDYQDSIDVVRQQLHTCIIPGHNADRPNFNNVCASVTELLVKLQGRVMRFEVENHSSHTQPDRQQNHAGVALATLPTLKRKNDEEHASTARGSPAEDAAYPLSFSILAAEALMRVAEPSSSRQQTVSRKKRPKTPVEQLEAPRRPESETYWGRGQVTPEKWEVMTEKTRMRHSHMGRIEETDAGMSPAESCENCSLRRWANCKVYKPEAVGKYAKASFKARGRPTLSVKESRQLERAIELEQRADRAKEAEKRRLESVKKRLEKDRRDSANKQSLQLGTQRRCDRFGYKSSQFHLGAFFGKKPLVNTNVTAAAERQDHGKSDEDEDDMDDDLDDASLLGAFDGCAGSHAAAQPVLPQPKRPAHLMPPPPLPVAARQMQKAMPATVPHEDFSDFFDSLDSGTQIAKALNSPLERRTTDTNFVERPTKKTAPAMLPPQRPSIVVRSVKNVSPPPVQEDLSDFFEDLETGTQIARELDQEPRAMRRASNASGSSFGSGSLDLTEEDMEMIDPPRPSAASPSLATTEKSADRLSTPPGSDDTDFKISLMPHAGTTRTAASTPTKLSLPVTATVNRKAMPPPRLPARRPPVKIANAVQRTDTTAKQQISAIRGPFLPASSLYCSPDLGFTSTQLESFIDDDLQLTQFG